MNLRLPAPLHHPEAAPARTDLVIRRLRIPVKPSSETTADASSLEGTAYAPGLALHHGRSAERGPPTRPVMQLYAGRAHRAQSVGEGKWTTQHGCGAALCSGSSQRAE